MYPIKKLSLELLCDVDLFKRFYNEVFSVEFPNEDEVETAEGFIEQYFRMLDSKEECRMSIYVMTDEQGNPIAGLIADSFRECSSSIIEFEVVRRDYQSKHLGEVLFQFATDDMHNTFFSDWKVVPEFIFWETEDYDYCRFSGTVGTYEGRWRYFTRLGAKRICIDYIQPALSDDKNAISFLDLCLWRYIQSDDCVLGKDKLLSFLRVYFKYAISSNEKNKEEVYDRIRRSIVEDDVALRTITF